MDASAEEQRTIEKTARDEDAVLPAVTVDERDLGWGTDPESGRRDEDWYRRERPPHHE